MSFVNPMDQKRRPVIMTNNKLKYEHDTDEHIVDSIRLHVSSRDAVVGGGHESASNEPSVFRFNVPKNISQVSSIELVDVEIPNTAQNVHSGNNRICFNEYGGLLTTLQAGSDGPYAVNGYYPLYLTAAAAAAASGGDSYSHTHVIDGITYHMPGQTSTSPAGSIVLYHGNYTGASTPASYTATLSTSGIDRYYAEITPGLYTASDYVAALQDAMNFGATLVSGTNAKPQNTYLATLDNLTGRLTIAAGAFTNTPGESGFARTDYETVPFSVRIVNVPETIKSTGPAVRNPLGVNITSAPIATGFSNKTQDSYNRVILQLQRGHGLIPGDSLSVACTEGTIEGVVVYVHGDYVHVLQTSLLNNGRDSLTVKRINVTQDECMKSVAQVGLNTATYKTGLVQSVQTQDASGSNFELRRVRANCSSSYESAIGSSRELQVIGFGESAITDAFVSGSTHDCLTLSMSHVFGDGTFIATGTSSTEIASAEATTDRVPRVSTLASQTAISGRTFVYETADLSGNGANVGSSTVTGSGKLDLTHARRVVFIGLEIVGTGKIGTVYRTDNDSDPYFARVQMSTDTDSIEFDSNCTMVGRYHFRAPTTITEMILRLYDESGEPFRSEGVATSVLLDFVQPVV